MDSIPDDVFEKQELYSNQVCIMGKIWIGEWDV